jgi:hypothetical protein
MSNKKRSKKKVVKKVVTKKMLMDEAKAYADSRKNSITYFPVSVALHGMKKLNQDESMEFYGDYGENIVESMIATLVANPPVGGIVFFKNFMELDAMRHPMCIMYKKFKVTCITLAPIAWAVITNAIKEVK